MLVILKAASLVRVLWLLVILKAGRVLWLL